MPRINPFTTATEIHKSGPQKNEWLIPGIIPRQGLVVLASAPKTGKTCFATALARAIVKGEEFLPLPAREGEDRETKANGGGGSAPAKGPILWCAHEESPYERALLHEGLAPTDEFYIAYTTMLPFLDEPEPKSDRYGRWMGDMSAPYVFLQAQEVGAKLIVIDPLHAAVSRANLAENQAARQIMGRLRRWSMHFDIAVLVLHHITKSATRGYHPERFADSAQILAAASCHFFLERHIEEGDKSRIVLYGKGRHPAPYPKLELESNGILDYQVAKPRKTPVKKTTGKSRILELISEGWHLTAQEIARNLDMNPNSARLYLQQLQQAGEIRAAKTSDRAAKFELIVNEGV